MIEIPKGVGIHPIEVEHRSEQAYCMEIEATSAEAEKWYFDIKQYVKSQTFPFDATKNERRTIQRLATQFIILRGVLYKKSPNQVLLRCLDEKQGANIIIVVHVEFVDYT